MYTIIHGSHRHGYHWNLVKRLQNYLEKAEIEVKIIDLAVLNFEYCCGNQICQEKECIYKNDELSRIFEQFILPAAGIYIVTPTYFNMPPAKLKNFIDRSNALLPELENKTTHPIFGTWISGEADIESIECNCRLLSDYATIMGWNIIEEICEKGLLEEEKIIDDFKIQKITKLICQKLK